MSTKVAPEVGLALEQVGALAVSRNEGRSGLLVWTGYLLYTDLYPFAPEIANGAFSSKAKRSAALMGFLVRPKNNMIVPTVLLATIARDPAGTEARRVTDAILSDEAAGRQLRKPLAYMAGVTDGIAVAVAVDDRFWRYETW